MEEEVLRRSSEWLGPSKKLTRRRLPMSVVLQFQGVWKEFRLGVMNRRALYTDIVAWWSSLRRQPKTAQLSGDSRIQGTDSSGRKLWALRDVSFELNQGEILGIIGSNGAGKTTLLQIAASVTAPTKGEVNIKGRVASLLKVGAGLHLELTGMENIFLYGAILGMTKKEITTKLDDIIDFSGLEDFLDTPVKRYSRGMKMRLAFSIASQLEPDILLIDEILAVGDAGFRAKCVTRIRERAAAGLSILLVSHSLGYVRLLCRRCLWLDGGAIAQIGDSNSVVKSYLEHVSTLNKPKQTLTQENASKSLILTRRIPSLGQPTSKRNIPDRQPQGALIREAFLRDQYGEKKTTFDFTDDLFLNIFIEVQQPHTEYITLVAVQNARGKPIYVVRDNDLDDSQLAGAKAGVYWYSVRLPGRLLKPSNYFLSVKIFIPGKGDVDARRLGVEFLIVDCQRKGATSATHHKLSIVSPEITWKLQRYGEGES